MMRQKSKITILVWTLLLVSCNPRSDKIYTCQGENNSYISNFDTRLYKFDDFSVILHEKFSLTAFIQGETLYEITGSISPNMEAITQQYLIFVQDKKSDTALEFDLISKKFMYSKPNDNGYHNYLEGRCRMVEI